MSVLACFLRSVRLGIVVALIVGISGILEGSWGV